MTKKKATPEVPKLKTVELADLVLAAPATFKGLVNRVITDYFKDNQVPLSDKIGARAELAVSDYMKEHPPEKLSDTFWVVTTITLAAGVLALAVLVDTVKEISNKRFQEQTTVNWGFNQRLLKLEGGTTVSSAGTKLCYTRNGEVPTADGTGTCVNGVTYDALTTSKDNTITFNKPDGSITTCTLPAKPKDGDEACGAMWNAKNKNWENANDNHVWTGEMNSNTSGDYSPGDTIGPATRLAGPPLKGDMPSGTAKEYGLNGVSGPAHPTRLKGDHIYGEHTLQLMFRRECWASIQVNGTAVSKIERTFQKDQAFNWKIVGTTTIRDGCPGDVSFNLDGKPVTAPHYLKHNKNVEEVSLP